MVKKILSTMLAATIMVGSLGIPTYAATSTTEDGTLQSIVTSQISSSWVVTVPGDISLEGNVGDYSASLGGDVANETSISVVPDSQFVLTNGEAEVVAYVTQEKQQFLGSEITEEGITTTGTITINDEMKAGTYVGSLNFHVNCTENLGNLLAKVQMMQDIDLYVMGDSIMDGVVGSGEEFYGIAEAVDNLYGTHIYKNYAVSGAFMSNKNVYLPNLVLQATSLSVRLSNNPDRINNSAIVFDGGGNDILNILEEDEATKIAAAEDIITSFYGVMYHLVTSIEEKTSTTYNHPIIYVIPNTPKLDDYWDSLKGAFEEAQEHYDNLIIIDCREFITESDLCSDKIHMNVSGQTKLSHKIVDVLYDWYN